MRNNRYFKILNWVLPIFVVFIILTGGWIEGLVILAAYIAYRFIIERDKFFSYIGKRKYLNGRLKKATEWYARAYKTNWAEAKVRISYAYALILEGRFHDADVVLAESRNVSDADTVIMQRAVCEAVLEWKDRGNLTGAIQKLSHLDETLRTSTYYGVMGKLMLGTGDRTRARDFSEEAYRYNSKHPAIMENLIAIYCLEGEFDRAIKVAPILLKKKPSTVTAFYYCGLAYEKEGDAGGAARCYKKALACDETILDIIRHNEINI